MMMMIMMMMIIIIIIIIMNIKIILITLFYDAFRSYVHLHMQYRQPISETRGIWAEL